MVGHEKLVFTLECSGADKCFKCGFKITEMCLGTLAVEKILPKHHSFIFLFVFALDLCSIVSKI